MIALFHTIECTHHCYQNHKRLNQQYLSTKFQDRSVNVTATHNFNVTIDSPSFSSVTRGTIHHSPANEHGEADYAIWHHCIRSNIRNILVVSSDTDTWVYGLGLFELNLFDTKHIFVQRGNTESYININNAVTLISDHSRLTGISYPVLTLVAIYVLTLRELILHVHEDKVCRNFH